LTENIKTSLEAGGITIPFPQQDVYMHNVAQ
jgi:small-conductance mechanosensitive channel